MSKKRIIALITVIVLLFATGVSVGVFLYTRGTTQAADGNQTTDQIPNEDDQVDNENPATPDDNIPNIDNENANTNNETTNNVVDNNTTNNEENTNNTENTNTAGNAENTANIENTNNTGNENNVENTNEAGNAGVTTNTGVNNIGETTIERVEEQERLVSKASWDWWKPMTFALTKSNVNVDEPELSVKKSVITETGDSKLVYAGQDMTYVIAVTNNSNVDMEDIEITDKIPQNTTFVSIEDAMIDDEAQMLQ